MQKYLFLLLGLTFIYTSCEKNPWTPFEEILSDPIPKFVFESGLGYISVKGEAVSINATKGHCWSTTNMQPTIEDDTTVIFESRIDTFESKIYCFKFDRDIYIRTYTIDESGNIHYSNPTVFSFVKDSWYQLSYTPFNGKDGAVGFAVDGKLYFGTGFESRLGSFFPTNDFYTYNPDNCRWMSLPIFPGRSRGSGAGFVIDRKIYVGTGASRFAPEVSTDYFNDFYCFDVDKNKWEKIASLPSEPRDGCFGVSINGKGYLIGGRVGDFTPINEVWEYSPTIDKWNKKNGFDTSRYSMTGFVVNSKLYIGTGTNRKMGSNDLWEYNSNTDKWNNLNVMFPGPIRSGALSFASGNFGYIGGGAAGFSTTLAIYNDFFRFDPLTANFTRIAQFPASRVASVGVSIDNIGYVIHGSKIENQNPIPVPSFWVYLPD